MVAKLRYFLGQKAFVFSLYFQFSMDEYIFFKHTNDKII